MNNNNFDSLELDISKYNYKDLLELFNLNYDFDINDLKKAKSKVLSSHPDKSGLDKQFFLFFANAYKIIYQVYEFRLKTKNGENHDLSNENYDYIDDIQENNKLLLDKFKKNKNLDKNFNIWFNELFEQVKINNEYNDSGYSEWLSNHETDIPHINNQNDINNYINNKKKILRDTQIVQYRDISEFNNNSYCDLTNQQPDNYSSGIFDKFQFNDLKQAHTETVVPVTDSDFKISYNTVEEARFERGQTINPLSNQLSKEILEKKSKDDNLINSNRAYNLIKQQEAIEAANNKWWSKLKLLS